MLRKGATPENAIYYTILNRLKSELFYKDSTKISLICDRVMFCILSLTVQIPHTQQNTVLNHKCA